MPPRPLLRTLCLTLSCAALLLMAPVETQAQPGRYYVQGKQEQKSRKQEQHSGREQRRQGASMSAQQAAAQAQSRHGGRVLKVEPRGKGYNVRLLQDDGRVISVFIGD